MQIYKNYFKKQTSKFNYPREDFDVAIENVYAIAVVLLGIQIGIQTRDSEEEYHRFYPYPSGAFLSTHQVIETVKQNYHLSPKEMIVKANEKVKSLNELYLDVCNYLDRDYFGCVVVMIK